MKVLIKFDWFFEKDMVGMVGKKNGGKEGK